MAGRLQKLGTEDRLKIKIGVLRSPENSLPQTDADHSDDRSQRTAGVPDRQLQF